jgi:hypothetical protein
MRIPFPERIPLTFAVIFALALCGLQQLQGTSVTFSLCAFLFIVITAIAFNQAGGFTRPSGGYIFFYSLLGVIVGLCWKAFLGEPADSNLQAPLLTMEVFLGGITSLLAAAFLSRRFSRKQAILQNVVKDKDLKNATVGCTVIGLSIILLDSVAPHANGSALSALSQVNRFLPMAVILGTIHEIRRTGGKRCFSSISVLAMVTMFLVNGLWSFSKEGMFTPVICWLIAVASLHYRFRIYQVILVITVFFLMFRFLVPYSQLGRDLIEEDFTFSDRLHVATSMLTDLETVRQNYVEQGKTDVEQGAVGYFNTPQGFFDRLQMLGPDDSLIATTQRTQPFGLSPIYFGITNIIPHFIWPDKPDMLVGNTYAHEVGGMIPEDDFTTGVSFGPSAEAFHIARWTGVFILAPILWALTFITFDSLCGDTRKSPWGLLVIAFFSHAAPEGALSNLAYLMTYVALSIALAAYASAYIAPVIGTLFVGAERAGQLRKTRLLNIHQRKQFS